MPGISGISHSIIVFGFTHQYLVYGLIILIGIIEGPLLSILLGVLLRLGYFNIAAVYISVIMGDLLGDTFWYYAGYHYGRRIIVRIGKWFNITEQDVQKAEKLFRTHNYTILFVSKISNGFGFGIPVLITAGVSKIPFLKFILTNAAGQLVWSAFLLSIGYFFGSLYTIIPSLLGKIFTVAVGVASTLVIIFYLKRRKNKKSGHVVTASTSTYEKHDI